MRRALAGLACRPGYVLTDGFPVRGLAVPALAMWQGDEVSACVAAASVVAKVTRDRIMTAMDEGYPAYGFAAHKGYSTRAHMRALAAHGPCPEHRHSFANVIGTIAGRAAVAGGPAVADLTGGADRADGADGAEECADGRAAGPAGWADDADGRRAGPDGWEDGPDGWEDGTGSREWAAAGQPGG